MVYSQYLSTSVPNPIEEDPMSKTIRNIRLALWILVILVVSLGMWSYYSTFKTIKIDYDPLAKEGLPLVDAIYRFRADQGLFPEYTDELTPYLKPPATLPAGWTYEPAQFVQKRQEPTRSFVQYDFHPGYEGWYVVDMDGTARHLKITQPPTPPTTLPAEQVRQNTLTQYNKRIKQEPTLQENYIAKGLLLQQLNQRQPLIDFCQQTIQDQPQFSWPRLVLAQLDPTPTTLPSTQPAPTTTQNSAPSTQHSPLTPAADLIAWVQTYPSFTHYIYLATYFDSKNDSANAAESVRRALACPLQIEPEDVAATPRYAFEAARIAYRAADYQLVLQIADAWQAWPGQPNEESYLAWRAAAQLALGQSKPALQSATQALASDTTKSLSAQNLPELQKAAAANNTHYLYNGGNSLRPLGLLPEFLTPHPTPATSQTEKP